MNSCHSLGKEAAQQNRNQLIVHHQALHYVAFDDDRRQLTPVTKFKHKVMNVKNLLRLRLVLSEIGFYFGKLRLSIRKKHSMINKGRAREKFSY